MRAVGLVAHPDRPTARDLSLAVAETLAARGIEVRMPAGTADRAGRPDLGVADEVFAAGLDLVIALGGDGTMLHTVHLVYPAPVPIVGVNAGRLGYLTALEAHELPAALSALLDEDREQFAVTPRMMIAAEIVVPGVVGEASERRRLVALNEVVLEKVESGRLVDIAVEVGGSAFTTYSADGVIVATPTGSTAYAFSVRGPIVSPRHRCLVVAPVAPHMLFDRTLVLGPDEVVAFEVTDRAIAIAVDGQNGGTLEPGTRVECTAADAPVYVLGRRDRGFHQILREKFALPDRDRDPC